ncbi:MAG: hypothetical protein RIM99_17070 [Cyclobacteriaceae bacterium]
MFLRKLLNLNNKVVWALVDLLMIIVGVYCAFLIQQYSEGQRIQKEKEKIYSALKYELENFRIFMPGQSSYAASNVEKWREISSNGSYDNFSDWIFIQPQHTYQIIEYAIGIQDNNIVDFQLYNTLQRLYVTVKSLEHAERLIMETSQKYLLVTKNMGSIQVEVRNMDNLENFKRFIRFSDSRAASLMRVATISVEALEIINERIGETKRLELERNLIASQITSLGQKERAVAAVKQHFPHFTKEELEEIYDENAN